VDVVGVGGVGGLGEVGDEEVGKGSNGMNSARGITGVTIVARVWSSGKGIREEVFENGGECGLFDWASKVRGTRRGFGCGGVFSGVGFGWRFQSDGWAWRSIRRGSRHGREDVGKE
jgi:hypothetical protein